MMQILRKILSPHSKQVLNNVYRQFHLDPRSIVIVSAVRTPWGQPLGQLSSVSSSDLASAVVEAAVKRSGAPLERIQYIYIAEEPCLYLEKVQMATNCKDFLKKSKFNSIREEGNVGLKSLQKAMDDVKRDKSDFVVVAGVESASEQLFQQSKWFDDVSRFIGYSDTNDAFTLRCKELQQEATEKGLYDAELVALRALQVSGKRRVQVEITQDELPEKIPQIADGASALVLTTMEKALKYNMKPLLVIKDLEIMEHDPNETLPSQLNIIQKLIDRTSGDTKHIHHCEVNNNLPQILDFIENDLKVPGQYINPYGGTCLGQTSAASLYRTVAHLAHNLKSQQTGFLINIHSQTSLALLMEKLPHPTMPDSLPRLTLYTKDPCHLCDVLVEELEMHFPGEYEMEKIYIDNKENVRYLRLYRHDIPVLYLNDQFLCMHRLNVRLLRQKLDVLKEQQN